MHTGEWTENWNGSVLGPGSSASERQNVSSNVCIAFLTSTVHLGWSEEYNSIGMQAEDREVLCPCS